MASEHQTGEAHERERCVTAHVSRGAGATVEPVTGGPAPLSTWKGFAAVVQEALNPELLRRWLAVSLTELRAKCDEINELNVFPVPDSDTGSNIMHTMMAAEQALEGGLDREGRAAGDEGVGDDRLGPLFSAAARGAIAGARGNSGIILSQVVRGLAEWPDGQDFGGDALAWGLEKADGLARAAVSIPMEGTVLSVLSAAAAAACAAAAREPAGGGLVRVATAAADAAYDALRKTTRQLDVLEAAGVVDAGGLGLLVILDALVEAATGSSSPRETFTRSRQAQLGRSGAAIAQVPLERSAVGAQAGAARTASAECTAGPDDYEVMYLLGASSEEAVETLRAGLEAQGNSVVIVGDGSGGWSVHVHLRDAGAAVELGLAAGTIRQVQITHFGAQQRDNLALRPGRVVLAVVHGAEAAELFRAEGAHVFEADGKVSAAGLLDAIVATGVGEVVLLPNGIVRQEDLVAVSAAARLHGQQVLPLPSASMVQGLASIAVHDPQRPATDDTYTMAEAAAGTRSGHLRVATERALTWAGTCEPGDALGLIGNEILVVESSLETAAQTLVDLMLATGGELVTVVAGRDATEDLLEIIEQHASRHHPAAEVMSYHGGQLEDVLQIGVE